MKATFRIISILLLLSFLVQCRKEIEPQIVNIPDDNFLAALIEEGVDTDGDGTISPYEAIVRTSLYVSEKSISDLTGIEAFGNLRTLYCSNNLLTNLDVLNNTALEWLDCSYNQLTTLNVNIALWYLSCRYNQLTTLNVLNNTGLKVLGCSGNQLSTLDVSNNNALKWLGCADNQLTSLDVSNNTMLETLWCSDCELSNLDVSNNNALEELRITEMPSLYKVCVWEMPFPPTGVEVDTTGSQNVYFTTDCN